MAKRPNYYQVHRNKKPKRRIDNINLITIYRTIEAATELVKTILKLQAEMTAFKKVYTPIPNYIEGGIFSGNPEYKIIEDNSGRTAKHIGSYEELTLELRNKMNLTSISSEELTKGNENFIEQMKKISTSTNSIFTKKASN